MAILVSSSPSAVREGHSHLHFHEYRLSATRATAVSIFCTFFEAFDVPVYWPILVVYFFVLFALTMRRQIQFVHSSCAFTSHADVVRQTYDQVQVRAFRYWPQDSLREHREQVKGRFVGYQGSGRFMV